MAKKSGGKSCKWVTADWASWASDYTVLTCHRTREAAEKAAARMRKGGRAPVTVMRASEAHDEGERLLKTIFQHRSK